MKLCFGCKRVFMVNNIKMDTCRYCGTKVIPDQDELPPITENPTHWGWDGVGWLAMYPAGDPMGRAE